MDTTFEDEEKALPTEFDYRESDVVLASIRCCGALLCTLVAFLTLSWIAGGIQLSESSFLDHTTAHHFLDMARPPPPPPSFFGGQGPI